MNLKELTHLDLLDLQSKITEEFKERKNSEKVRVFKVHTLFRDPEYYLNLSLAIDKTIEDLGDEFTLEDFNTESDVSICLSVKFIDKQEVKFCKDYSIF